MKAIALLVLTSLSACATYAPVQMGNGKFTGKEVKSCIHNVLFIQLDNNFNTRIDKSMTDYGLTSADIFSIEKKAWFWTFPFYYYQCNILTLNETGAKKITNADEFDYTPPSPQAEAHGTVVQNPPAPPKPREAPASLKEKLKACNDLSPLARDRCREDLLEK